MKRIPQGKYSKEFRQEAANHVIDQGLSIPEASRRLDVPKSRISYWVRANKAGNLKNIEKNRRELTDTELEIANSRLELAKVKINRVRYLKKSRGILRE